MTVVSLGSDGYLIVVYLTVVMFSILPGWAVYQILRYLYKFIFVSKPECRSFRLSESDVFNCLEETVNVAVPRTPVLHCAISKSLCVPGKPNAVSPFRCDWVVRGLWKCLCFSSFQVKSIGWFRAVRWTSSISFSLLCNGCA